MKCQTDVRDETKCRNSRQREAILNNLRGRCDHPSADTVYLSVRSQLPKISMGTVYRNLNELYEQGKLLRFTTNGKEHFDGNITPHYHFICDSCGEIYDVFDDTVGYLEQSAVKRLQCTVSDIKIVINGCCKACCDKMK